MTMGKKHANMDENQPIHPDNPFIQQHNHLTTHSSNNPFIQTTDSSNIVDSSTTSYIVLRFYESSAISSIEKENLSSTMPSVLLVLSLNISWRELMV